MITVDGVSTLWNVALGSLGPFGALGLMFGFLSGLMPRRGSILRASAACATCFALHYLTLGSLTGTAMCMIAVVQSLMAARFVTPYGPSTGLCTVFAGTSVLAVCLTAATWAGWPSAFAGVGALFATTARLQACPDTMRRLFLGASLAWAGHNLLVGSVFGLTCDVLTISALTVALVRPRGAGKVGLREAKA